MKLTQHNTGFSYGPSRVTRTCSDEDHGVWLVISGEKEQVEIRVTKGGRLRIGKIEKAAGIFNPDHN